MGTYTQTDVPSPNVWLIYLSVPCCPSPPLHPPLSDANAALYNIHIDLFLPPYVNTIHFDQWTEKWHEAERNHTQRHIEM